jgi:CheY-like chemotaxis protein
MTDQLARKQSEDPIRVAIVDDHPVVREGTAALLSNVPGLCIAGTAGSLEDAALLLDPAAVDMLLLDIRLGSQSGLTLLGRGGSLPAIVVLTAYDYPQYAAAALRLGASGFVLKTAPIAELVEAIRRAASGGLAFGVRPVGLAGSPVDGRRAGPVGPSVFPNTRPRSAVQLPTGLRALNRAWERPTLPESGIDFGISGSWRAPFLARGSNR